MLIVNNKFGYHINTLSPDASYPVSLRLCLCFSIFCLLVSVPNMKNPLDVLSTNGLLVTQASFYRELLVPVGLGGGGGRSLSPLWEAFLDLRPGEFSLRNRPLSRSRSWLWSRFPAFENEPRWGLPLRSQPRLPLPRPRPSRYSGDGDRFLFLPPYYHLVPL